MTQSRELSRSVNGRQVHAQLWLQGLLQWKAHVRMARDLANLLPCHTGEGRLPWSRRERTAPLHRCIMASEGNAPASLFSPPDPYPRMWSVALAAVKMAETGGAKTVLSSLIQATSCSWADLPGPPWHGPAPEGRSRVTKGIFSPGPSRTAESQRLNGNERGDVCSLPQGRHLPLNPPRLKKCCS